MRQLRVLSGVATICAALITNQSAQAGYGSYGSSGGYAAAYGSSGGYGSSGAAVVASYGSSGGASNGSSGGGHVGPLRRLAARIHAHHAAKVAARGSSGGYGSSGSVAVYRPAYGSSGGSSGGGYGSSGGSSGGYAAAVYSGGSSGSVAVSSPVYESASPVMHGGYEGGSVAEPAVAEPMGEASIDRDAALLTVAVAEDAKVTVNGLPTSSQGAVRQFMSKGLKDGLVYTYVINVTYPGVDQAESKTVKLRAGAIERLVFAEPSVKPSATSTVSKKTAPETIVTLRVPEDAKVNLAGNDTKGEGPVRTFRTRLLADGQKWANYTIRVTATVNGVAVTKEKTIDLAAGADHDFEFDFINDSIASR